MRWASGPGELQKICESWIPGWEDALLKKEGRRLGLISRSGVAFFFCGGFAEFVLLAFAAALDAAGFGRGFRWGFGCFETGDVLAGDGLVLAFFDEAEVGVGIGGDKADGCAAFAGPAGAADAVDVVAGGAGEVVVEDDGEIDDVDAPGGEVGGDEDGDGGVLEPGEGGAAGALAEFAVEGVGIDAGAPEFFGDVVGGVLGGDEDEDAFPSVGGDEVAEEGGALVGVDADGALLDVGCVDGLGDDFDAGGIAEDALRDGLHLLGEGGGEEEGLPLGGEEGEKAVEFLGEAEIEHAVRLIEDEGAEGGELDGVAFDEVEEAAGRGDEEVGPAAQGHHLRVDGDAAYRADNLDAFG